MWARMSARWRETFTSILIVLVSGLVYLRSLGGEYGRSDDYVVLTAKRSFRLGDYGFRFYEQGRLVPAASGVWLFTLTDSVADLTLVRWFAWAAVAAGGVVVAVWFLRTFGHGGRSATGAVVVGLVPLVAAGAPVLVTWAVMAPLNVAIPAALGAGVLLARSGRALSTRAVCGAVVLACVAAFSYQPFALLGLILPYFVVAWDWAHDGRLEWIRAAAATGIVGGALALNAVFVLIVGGKGADRLRGAGVGDRLSWLGRELLPRTIDGGVPSTGASTSLTVLSLVVLMATPLLLGWRYAALAGAVAAAWAVSILATAIGEAELWAAYRVTYAAQTTLWIGAALCFGVTIAKWSPRREAAVLSLAVLGLAGSLGLLLVAGRRAYVDLAVPNRVDWASLRCELDRRDDPDVARSVMVLNDFSVARTHVFGFDEYGLVGSAIPWALGPMAWLAGGENAAANGLPFERSVDDFVAVPADDPAAQLPGAISVPQNVCGALD